MDWKEFISSIVSSLAAVAFIVYLLRHPIGNVIGSLRKLSYRGAEAEFGRSLDKAETAARQAEIPQTTAQLSASASNWENTSAGWGESTSLADVSPRAAVIEAWLRLEREVLELAQIAGIDLGTRRLSIVALVKQLQEQGVVDPTVAEVIEQLRRARNVAVHERTYTVSPGDAAEYVQLAERVAATLRETRTERSSGT